jgi:hypothetical protein
MCAEKTNPVCAPSHRPSDEGSKGGRMNERMKLTFYVYINKGTGRVEAVDMECRNGCSDDCPVHEVCDRITATLFKMIGGD